MGRPATAPRKLKDGFYIEVCQKGARNGIKIWCLNEERMLRAAEDYRRSKDVIVLGEHINGKWVSEMKPKKLEREKAAQEKKLAASGTDHTVTPKPVTAKVADKKADKGKPAVKKVVAKKAAKKKPVKKKAAVKPKPKPVKKGKAIPKSKAKPAKKKKK